MKGDFTRFTHDPEKHYSGVLKQQGRVDLEADWNEYVQIRDYINRVETRDIIGHCGVPNSQSDSFKIQRIIDNTGLELSPGQIYVDGILCEFGEQAKKVILNNPATPANNISAVYLAYLDVWQRHITAIEDKGLLEVALGGPDTTTRIKTEWQVRLRDVTTEVADPENPDCKPFCCTQMPWVPKESISTGRMAAHAEKPEGPETLCEVQARAGYRGLENRLYRVEIHQAGEPTNATFKWSRDNGSVVFSIQSLEIQSGKSILILNPPVKDESLSLHIGDWVEILDDQSELNGQPGLLAQIAPESDGTNLAKGVVVIKASLAAYKSESNPKIRRWDEQETAKTSLSGGSIKIIPEKWIPLEDGVEVRFTGGIYQTGDYWLIPARTRLRDVVWKQKEHNPEFLYAFGIEHHYCALALIKYNGKTWEEPKDCRKLFPPLTEIQPGCCCISVKRGESLQQAVDSVVAAGGGCISLCEGIYEIHGPLVLSEASNLTIHGVNNSTVLEFYGTDEHGEGGIVLRGCSHITLADMFIRGNQVPSLISTKTGRQPQPNKRLLIDRLTLFNPTRTREGAVYNCALRLANSLDISITDCRMMAENGIVSLFGDDLPEAQLTVEADRTDEIVRKEEAARKEERAKQEASPKNKEVVTVVENATESSSPSIQTYGIGMRNLRLQNSLILYSSYGIWTLQAQDWQITNCHIQALPESASWPSGSSSKTPCRAVLDYIEKAGYRSTAATTGTAIKALVWKDCRIDDCQLSGETGLNILFCLGGRASRNTVKAVQGLLALWLNEADWSHNRVDCVEGVGIGLAGSYASCLRNNQLHGGTAGIANASLARWLHIFGDYLAEVVGFYTLDASAQPSSEEQEDYELRALWLLLEETVSGLKLRSTLAGIQALVDTFPNFKGIPVMLWVATYIYPGLKKSSKLSGNIPLPLIGLQIQDNDIESSRSGISLRNFIPLGGMRIGDNRVQTLSGQAIEIKAYPYTVNPQLVILGCRFLYNIFPGIIQQVMKYLHVTDLSLQLSEEQKKAIENIGEALSARLSGLGQKLNSIPEEDYRIENNTLRSQRTAIESNLFELTVQNNHITMEESPVDAEESDGILDLLGEYGSTKNLAAGMRQKSKTRMKSSAQAMNISGDSDEAKNTLSDIAELSCRINRQTANPELKARAQELVKAADANDAVKISESLEQISEILGSYVDSAGIWVKGAGCRIIGNTVIVPMDTDSKTWAQGGILFWDDEGAPVWILAYIDQVFKLYVPGMSLPSLLTATETLIDNNEIIRGISHGIGIGGIANMPNGMGLVDLKIRENQIRDMAGAGIAFDERSLAIGVDIEGNRIVDCGSIAVRSSMAAQGGGLVIRNAASCRIHNNRITCKSHAINKVMRFAVDLRTVYGLKMSDNYIQHDEVSGFRPGQEIVASLMSLTEGNSLSTLLANLYGCIYLSEINGEVSIENNDVMLYHGTGSGLVMGNIEMGENWDAGLKKMMQKVYRKDTEIKEKTSGTVVEAVVINADTINVITNASVQGNHFESLAKNSFFAFLLANLKELNFSGNNVRTNPNKRSPGIIQDLGRGVISHNILDMTRINRMEQGVIAGNSSRDSLELVEISAQVAQGLNAP